jgi:hypothetical protein
VNQILKDALELFEIMLWEPFLSIMLYEALKKFHLGNPPNSI